jgi:hypothetical protein
MAKVITYITLIPFWCRYRSDVVTGKLRDVLEMSERVFYSQAEACRYLGVSEYHLAKLREQKLLASPIDIGLPRKVYTHEMLRLCRSAIERKAYSVTTQTIKPINLEGKLI